MPKLLSRLAHACLSAAIAIPLISTSAAAGGSGSLFSSNTGMFGAVALSGNMPVPETTDASLLLYATSYREKPTSPPEDEIWIDPSDYLEPQAAIDTGEMVGQFHLASTRTSYSQRDVECMAEALYHEARGEGTRGQQAVAEVILNRVESRQFPSSVCGVINQPSQFSYTIGGTKPIRNKAAYLRARNIAEAALSGAPRDLTGGATYFHTPAVRPSWSHRFHRTVQIGRHIFYRPGTRVASN